MTAGDPAVFSRPKPIDRASKNINFAPESNYPSEEFLNRLDHP